MRYLLILIVLVLLPACGVLAPTAPSPQATNTTAPAIATVQPPTNIPPAATPSVPPLPAAPTTAPGATGTLFGAALRPEFQSDLTLVHSPTIYRMDLRLNPDLTQMSGQESVTYTNRESVALNEVYLRLFANYPGGGGKITVSDVQVNSTPAAPTLESQDTALHVPLAQPLTPGQQLNLALHFEVTIPVSNTAHYADFTNDEGILTLPSIYPLIPAYDAKGWHIEVPPDYGDLVYADTSFYDVRITAPAATTVIASGTAVETTTQGADKTWHYIGAPMRDFDIDVSAALKKSSKQVDDITVNSYYLSQDEASGQDALKWASDALSVYQKRIGPYPFRELDVVETPTQAGGIEYPGLVVISSELYRDSKQRQFFEFAVAHEVGHQWWYSQVGDDQVNTPWMDESFVQYATLIYEQDTYGDQTGQFVLRNIFQMPYDRVKQRNEDMPVGLPVSAYTEEQYGVIVYDKGPLFFDAVRKQIGDESFFKFMQTYYARYKYQIATPDELRQTINQVSGQNIDALYNQWILGK